MISVFPVGIDPPYQSLLSWVDSYELSDERVVSHVLDYLPYFLRVNDKAQYAINFWEALNMFPGGTWSNDVSWGFLNFSDFRRMSRLIS